MSRAVASWWHRIVAGACLSALVGPTGCGGSDRIFTPDTPDSASSDAAVDGRPSSDAASNDAGSSDASRDVSTGDASRDATADARVEAGADATSEDAARGDAQEEDSGPVDATPDTAPPDGGPDAAQDANDATPPDRTPPTVESTAPADTAVGIPVTTTIGVDFSEPMDPSTVALTVEPAITLGAATWNAGHTSVAYAPSASLAASTQYKVIIAGSDVAGNALAGGAGFTFTTQAAPDTTAPTIVATSPTNGASGVPTNTAIAITFSEPMDEGTVAVITSPEVLLGPPAFNNDKTQVTYTPTAPLATSTDYTVNVTGQDPAKNALAGAASFRFATAKPADTTAPTVLSVAPANGSTNVATNSSVVLIFSEAMDTGASAAALTLSSAGTYVTCAGGSWSWNAGGNVATCVPVAALAFSTTYNVSVTTAAKDVAGNAMAAVFGSSFTTGSKPDTDPPTVVSVSPANGSIGAPRATSIAVTFSEAMDLASAQAALQIAQPAGVSGVFAWSNANRTMTFTPSASFAYGTVVQYQVSAAAKDAAGNPKAASDSFSFTVLRTKTTNLPCIAALDGFVNSLPAAYTNSALITGDNGGDITLRAFAAFDMSSLPTTLNVTSAYLYLYQYSVSGTPYGSGSLGSLLWRHVDFGAALEAADYNTPTLTHLGATGTLSTTATAEWKSASVLISVRDDLTNGRTRANRSEYLIRFTNDLTTNTGAYYANLYACDNATVSNRPYLQVTYEYP